MPKPPRPELAPTFDPALYVPALLSTLNNRLSSGASDLYLARFGVGINEWRILTVLAQSPGCTPAFVADKAAIHVTVISRGARALADKGLVTIERAGWQRHLTLTAEGRRMHDAIAALALQREARLLAGLTAAEVRQLRRMLAHMTGNLAAVDLLVSKVQQPTVQRPKSPPDA